MTQRIAFFLPDMRGGGAERAMATLAREFVKRGIEVDVVLMRAEGELMGELPGSARVFDLKAPRMIASVPRLARYLRAERPISLLAVMLDTALFAVWASRLAQTKTPITAVAQNHLSVQARDAERGRGGIKRRFARWLMTRALKKSVHAIVAVSEGVANDIASTTGIDRSKINVIYNPIPVDEIREKAKAPWPS